MAGIDSYAKLVLHCDGTDGSTTFTDSSLSPRTVTAVGNAQIDTAQSKFGGASGLFDGTGDALTVPDSADWDFGTGDFTIDFWFRTTVSSESAAFIGRGASGYTPFLIWLNAGWLNVNLSETGSSWLWQSGNLSNTTTNTWYHVALSRSGTSFRVFRDGTQVGTTFTSSASLMDSAAVLRMGSHSAAGGDFSGWMEEIRVSKDIARWTANFTPPTEAYSAEVGIELLQAVSLQAVMRAANY